MSISLTTGTQLFIAKTYGPVVTMSAVSKATEAVATLGAGHAVIVGDYLEVTSGWGKLDKRVVRVKTVVTNDVTFEGINTSGTTYVALGGVGSVRRITDWDEITQIKDLSSSGGDQQFADVTDLGSTVEKKIPTTRSAVTGSLTVFDDPSLAWYATATLASDASLPTGLRFDLTNGSKLVANTYVSLLKVPQISKNEALTTQLSFTYAADPVRYAT